jgi:mannose-1-phosphate guanylyltransferase
MVLCAGLGTRLRPLTEELPKPLVPIGDRSILAHIAERLAREGFQSLVINTHWLPEAFDSVLGGLPIPTRSVHEPVIRGTAGGVAGARSLLGPAPVLVWNGDILVDPPIGELLERAGEGLAMAVVPRGAREGTVGRDRTGRVVRLRGEVFGDEVAGGDYVGVAALGSRCLAELPERGCLVGDWALPELRRGGTVQTAEVHGEWVDAGDPAAYLEANLRWLDRTGGNEWLGPDTAIGAGVRLHRSIVGPGAHIHGHGLVSGSVLWKGAEVAAPLERSIVTSSGRIVATA